MGSIRSLFPLCYYNTDVVQVKCDGVEMWRLVVRYDGHLLKDEIHIRGNGATGRPNAFLVFVFVDELRCCNIPNEHGSFSINDYSFKCFYVLSASRRHFQL